MDVANHGRREKLQLYSSTKQTQPRKVILEIGSLRVELVQSLQDLELFADVWNYFALNAPQGLPMLSHA